MRTFVLAVVSIVLTGCGTTYQQSAVKPAVKTLEGERAVLISVPKDGFYGATVYQGSGQMTAAATRAAFLRHASRAEVTTACHGDDCLDRAAADGYGYYVRPDILRWEDRATEWSGISDKAEIRLSVYDAVTHQEIASQVLAGKSSFWTFGGDHPQDLLPEPLAGYAEQLYQ